MKHLLVIVNQHQELVATQTTFLLIEAAKARGLPVRALDLDEALAYPFSADDVVFLRTNPGRDLNRLKQHHQILDLLEQQQSLGTRVINAPDRLRTMFDKSYLLRAPKDLVPITELVETKEQLESFLVRVAGTCIVKPLTGTRGIGVQKVSPETVDAIEFSKPWIAQEFIARVSEGDSRILVAHGKPIRMQNHYSGILRVPAEGSILGNLHAGAKPAPLNMTPELINAAEQAAEFCQSIGIAYAGADFCGAKLIELNTFSPGGLYWAERFHNISFRDALLDALLFEGPTQ